MDIQDVCTSPESFRFLIVRTENGGIRDLFRFLLFSDKASGAKFLHSSDHELLLGGGDGAGVTPDHPWVIFVSILDLKIIVLFGKPMEWTGYFVEFLLNLLSENGNLPGLLHNLLRGKVVMPQRGSETFISAIGHLDGRIDLYESNLLEERISEHTSRGRSGHIEIGDRALMDFCMMASKLAYENDNVIRNVVNLHWKMHFVDFYNCWNDYHKERSTQVFILCDKPRDANLILISFRGTEPFDADDWCTNFDFSWFEIPKLGKVHMGFPEALGLGNRVDTSTFQKHLQVNNINITSSNAVAETRGRSEGSASISSSTSSEEQESAWDRSSGSEGPATTGKKQLVPDMVEMTAYYTVKSKLKSLLNDHKNAKFIVTGHSLGGALAVLFPTVLVLHEEKELMHRLLGICTFGQPRVGSRRLGRFMEAHVDHPVPKYFRVVYCNDLVPRLPYDDGKTFLYKHFGVCLYYNSFYIEQKVDEEPNRNYFGMRYLVPEYLNAFWELSRSFITGYVSGPEYEEGWLSILLRIVGLALPGISAHSHTDYVNSVRLGRESSIYMSSL
ncbi:hypothetical protein F0562_024245 [Nyssa sinensis]|uniref:Fungal lipase-type domain-containing protein n=1 Tax=Nyssa sinensis TaxID=561372 RepID=A0A5J5BE82_9ASTE|nr:hypothetical protein F0562_024245 [Nyssa sinensis]